MTREGESHGINAEVQEGMLTVNCINFNEMLGIGTTNSVEIGMVQGKKVRMHLWSYLMGQEEVRKVEYSIFKEK